MISQKLLHLMTKHAEDMAARWSHDVKKNLDTINFKKLPEDKLREVALDVCNDMARWITDPKADSSWVEETYTKKGANQHKRGVHLSEAVKAWILMKHHLWNLMKDEGVFDTATSMYQGLELLQDISDFFDRMIYFIVLGYEREASIEVWKRP